MSGFMKKALKMFEFSVLNSRLLEVLETDEILQSN